MKTLILTAIRCSLMFLVPSVAYAISAQWDLDPISGDWNTAANWTPMEVPNGPADNATFGLSKTTDVLISADTEVNGIIFTPTATNPYTITASPGLTLTISGVGITNNSGLTQNLATVAGGEIRFANNATAGSNVSISNEGGTTNLFNHSSAAGASIFNLDGGTTNFFDHSTAGNSAISADTSSGSVQFFDNSTAGSATIALEDSILQFANNSTAGNSSIANVGGLTSFFNRSTAGNSSIGAAIEAFVEFSDNSTAGNSSITAAEESFVDFMDNSTAGSATIALFDDGFLNFRNTSTAANASIFGGFISFFGSSRGYSGDCNFWSERAVWAW
jgi:hypothetical protein